MACKVEGILKEHLVFQDIGEFALIQKPKLHKDVLQLRYDFIESKRWESINIVARRRNQIIEGLEKSMMMQQPYMT